MTLVGPSVLLSERHSVLLEKRGGRRRCRGGRGFGEPSLLQVYQAGPQAFSRMVEFDAEFIL